MISLIGYKIQNVVLYVYDSLLFYAHEDVQVREY